MLEYAGKNQRKSDLFQDKDGWAKSKKLFSNMFSDVENVLLQHKPLVATLVDQVMKGKLSQQQYPATQAFDFREKPVNLIVFMVGGATYEEAMSLSTTYNIQEDRVLLGGTYLHNSKSFLAEVSQIKQLTGNKPTMLNFEI